MPHLSMKPSTQQTATFKLDADTILSHVEVMRKQEETSYSCGDYLDQQLGSIDSSRCPLERQKKSEQSSLCSLPKKVVEECRVKMSEWCYRVADHCKCDRETVAIAISYLDRYLLTKKGRPTLGNKQAFQLAAMTSLYIAVKLFEPEIMELRIFANLSHGSYTEKQIVDSEMEILDALNWRVQPPTALSFVRHFFSLLPVEDIHDSVQKSMFDFAQFQTELAINDFYFVNMNPSSIAFAATVNAMEVVDHAHFSASMRWSFLRKVTKVTRIDMLSPEICEAKQRLLCSFSGPKKEAFVSTKTVPKSVLATKHSKEGSMHESPRCVAENATHV